MTVLFDQAQCSLDRCVIAERPQLCKLPGALLGGRWVDQLGPVRLARLYLLPYALAILPALALGGDVAIWALFVGAGLGT
ncbi:MULTISPECIES: hypothetical protein [Halomonadaceae]|uniref:hypothetical protein n=1 Tax=Halomonadaceae TaxID=28256 RepID=UPI00200C5297|nr:MULTISPECIES: hypothetical protein [Halomonas]